MISKAQRRNAERIVELADAFGHLYFNAFGQTPEKTLNLSVPCARLVVAGIVTGVDDSNDSVNQAAVDEMERYCRAAVDFATEQHGSGWWTAAAARLLPRPELEASSHTLMRAENTGQTVEGVAPAAATDELDRRETGRRAMNRARYGDDAWLVS